VLALPIPYRGIKKWGLILIVDALSAIVLVTIYSILIMSGEYILSIIGYSWKDFMGWLISRTGMLIGIFGFLTYLSSVLRTASLFIISSPIGVALTLTSLALSALKAIYLLALTIYTLKDKLIALGILLYSLPFRIGKGVGAFIIAASIIMYVGFPLLPAFISFLTPNSSPITSFLPQKTINIRVIDMNNHPIPYPILLIYRDNNEEVSAIILGNSEGNIVLGDGKDILPRNATLKFNIEVYGYIIEPSRNKFNVKDLKDKVTLKLNRVIYIDGSLILVSKGMTVDIVSYQEDYIELNIHVISNITNRLRIVKYANVKIDYIILNNNNTNCMWSKYSWRDIELSECGIDLTSTFSKLIIVFHDIYKPIKPKVNEKRLIAIDDLKTIFYSFMSLITSYLYTLVFLPSVYLAMLTSMSLALAKVFGGGVKIKLL